MKRTILLITALLLVLAIGCGQKPEQKAEPERDPNAVYYDPNTVHGGEYGELYFEANGVRFGIYDEAEPVLAGLEKEKSTFTRESCAFDNADVFHLFESFEIMTNVIDGVARITAIQVDDDRIETPQGLRIGMSEEDAAKAFPALKDADWKLIDGTALLSVTFSDGRINGIVYTPSGNED